MKYYSNCSLYPHSRNGSSFTRRTLGLFSFFWIIWFMLLAFNSSCCFLDYCDSFKSFTLHITLKTIENVEPLPTSDHTLTVPPIYSTIYLQIDRPRPLPDGFCLRCYSKLLKFINKLSSLSSGIPQPKSWIPSSNLT